MHATHIIDFGFDYSGNEAAEGWLRAHAASDSRRKRRVPAGFFGDKLERGFQPRRTIEHAEAEGDGVNVPLARQLVHEALDREYVVVRTDAAPEAGRDPGWFSAHIF